jgi:glycosyltransferase involved in cell wall biosynthesis
MIPGGLRVGYVVKVYPRYSETFIVNEILAHEAAGLPIDIFSLRSPRDTHFQDVIARVRAGVTYLNDGGVKAETFWKALRDAESLPDFRRGIQTARTVTADEVYSALLLANAVRQRGIGHLHAHFATSATTVARVAAAFAGITYSFTAHAKDIFHESVVAEDLHRKLADAPAAVTVSDYNLAYLRRTYGEAAAALRRVYNGIDLERFPYRPPGHRHTRIVAVGRLVEKKGFSTLIDACALLVRHGVPIECDVIGTGELEGGLRTQIEQRGLQEVVAMRGPQPQSAVVQAIASASALAVPCVVGSDGNRDGLPTVLLEAMALGTPCVATDVTGIPEIVEHEKTGLIVAQHDAAGLAAAIQRLWTDARLQRSLAAAARARIEADFDNRRTAAELRDVFRTCVAAHLDVAAGL